MGVTREYAEEEVAKFNEWYWDQPDDVTENYSGPASIDKYVCLNCSRDEFREATDDDCPYGSTINPVIWEE